MPAFGTEQYQISRYGRREPPSPALFEPYIPNQKFAL
jgi:hypothetical protein